MQSTKNSQLGYYLAGLIEGDGNIWTSKVLKSPKGRVNNPCIGFAFHKNEVPLFKHIKDIFGTGSLYQVKIGNTCAYRIYEKKTLIKLINLINGKFRTPKIQYLHKAIDRVNLIHNLNIPKLPLDNSSLESNPWLSGFTDADGNFYINLGGVYGLNNSKTKGRVICAFSISQKVIDNRIGISCVPFMTEIANLFECKITYLYDNSMRLLVGANSKQYIIKNYFDKYPLMTSKYLNYLSFLEGTYYLGKRLTDQEIIEIRKIKNSMNTKRTFYNWDHLNNFYK